MHKQSVSESALARNLHPADELGEVQEQIGALLHRQQMLRHRLRLTDWPYRVGATYYVEVSEEGITAHKLDAASAHRRYAYRLLGCED